MGEWRWGWVVSFTSWLLSFLSLGATAQGELWPPDQSASILLYSEADWLLNNLVFMV
jgi:hypothetical protein